MEEEEPEEKEAEGVQWETQSLRSHHPHHHPFSSLPSPPFSYSSHILSPIRFTPHNHHREEDLSVFPPINHEGLPIPSTPPPPRAPLSFSSSQSESDSQPPSPSFKPPVSLFAKWFGFALRLWNPNFQSVLIHVRSLGIFSSLRFVAAVVPFLVVLWFWVRRLRWLRWRKSGGRESVEQLKLLIKEKDEKIIRLLEQIAQMNKLLIARYRIPVIKSS